MGKENGVAAGAGVLMGHFVGLGVDAGDGDLEHRDPHRAAAGGPAGGDPESAGEQGGDEDDERGGVGGNGRGLPDSRGGPALAGAEKLPFTYGISCRDINCLFLYRRETLLVERIDGLGLIDGTRYHAVFRLAPIREAAHANVRICLKWPIRWLIHVAHTIVCQVLFACKFGALRRLPG